MLRLQELRTTAGLTQRELAEKIGVKNYTVANWEQNRTEPNLRDLIDLADFFECSIDYLLGRENDFGNILLLKEVNTEHAELISLYAGLTKQRQQLIKSILKDLRLLTEKENQ